MRFTLPILALLFLSSCGGSVEGIDKTDSVNNADSVAAVADTSPYALMTKAAIEVKLPAIIESDSMKKLPGLLINDVRGYALLPGDFDPQSYSSVYCIGRSLISKDVSALWFRLNSPGEYEEAPESVDIMMVLYDQSGKPLDVCRVASEALGYSYSYVRTDSLFTIEVDEMENINISTYAVEIRPNGFMPEGAETKTFQPDATGKNAGEAFKNEFINSHKR